MQGKLFSEHRVRRLGTLWSKKMDFRIAGNIRHYARNGMSPATDPTFQSVAMNECNFFYPTHRIIYSDPTHLLEVRVDFMAQPSISGGVGLLGGTQLLPCPVRDLFLLGDAEVEQDGGQAT